MTILWCGGEDIDFLGSNKPLVQYSYYTSTYSRYASYINEPVNGAQTEWWGPSDGQNLWVSCMSGAYGSWIDHGGRVISVLNSVGAGFVIGSNGSSMFLNNTNGTNLATGSQWFGNGFYGKIDIHIENCGTNGTITVYFNGVEHVKYTGDIRPVSGNIDFVTTAFYLCTYRLCGCYNSEIIIADEDTRFMRLKTLAPSANGDTNGWTGTYSDVSDESTNTVNKIYTSNNNSDFQCNLTGMPSSEYSVKAVKTSVLCADPTGTFGIQLGIKSNGSVSSGSTQNVGSYWETKQQLLQVNPTTGVKFTPAEIDALQINLRAITL